MKRSRNDSAKDDPEARNVSKQSVSSESETSMNEKLKAKILEVLSTRKFPKTC